MIERLMILDGVLADRNYTWLGTERDKRDYFDRMLESQHFRSKDYPHVTYLAATRRRDTSPTSCLLASRRTASRDMSSST
jgi:hypothetical protein